MGSDAGAGASGWPAGLTDEVSRELLASGELSWCYAYLDLRATTEGPPKSAALWFGELLVEGGAGLFVLGEALYPSGREDVTVLLDGASGEVYLACLGEDGLLRCDLLASSPRALVTLMLVVESTTLCAAGDYERAEDDDGAPYGPTTVDAAVRLGLREMREADPQLWERTDGRPAHWEIALGVRALAWGAAPGKPGEGFTVGSDLVADLAELTGDGTLRRFRPDELPEPLLHDATRRLLTDVGLPLSDRCALTIAADGPLTTMAQRYPSGYAPDRDGELTARPYQGDYVALGGWMYDLDVALDCATGRLELPDRYDDDRPAPYLHRDLATLLHVLWTYERLRAERRRWNRPGAVSSWAVFRPRDLLDSVGEAVLRALDPPAWATESHFWPMRTDDGHMGALLE
ncbi:SUKH-4 family immunity protein [Kitasatospora sp. NPDC094019]|uniref:SUKH-4 family immunity protein n=1 Tax=Kitasatospora sp. NPDC094019 TaxID=3364091 RepID=UPI0037FD786D